MTLKDHTHAYACGANARLYIADPGPRKLNVGTRTEPRYVSRREAWVASYARYLLTRLDADPDRLTAAAADCRGSAQASLLTRMLAAVLRSTERLWLHHYQTRHNTGRWSPKFVHRYDWREDHLMGAEIAAQALDMVREAGADQDPAARKRLLAGALHQETLEVFGPVMDERWRAEEGERLLEALRETEDS